MRLKDFTSALHMNKITFIEKRNEIGNIFVFEFKKPKELEWQAGQFGFFWFNKKKVKGKRVRFFTVASTSDEEKIMIATMIGPNPSSFKKNLLDLKPGEKMTMLGPMGWLYIHDYDRPTVLIAGGIGITPIRSMLKGIKGKKTNEIVVLYIDSRKQFPFKKELMAISSDKIVISFLDNIDSFDKKLNELQKKYQNQANYFISGPPKMVKSVQQKLKKQKIKNTIKDPFLGY